MGRLSLLALSILAYAPPCAAARSEALACRPAIVGENPQPVPRSLAPAVIAAFGVRMTPAQVMRNGVVRCAHGVVLACLTGANLNCGKADAAKTSAGGSRWCATHPNAEFVPMFATGHATVYAWRCNGTTAVPARQVREIGPDGFVAENWRPLLR